MISAFSLYARVQKQPKTDVVPLTQMRRRGRTRGAAHRPSRRYTQSAPEEQLRRARAEQSASSIPLAPASAKRGKKKTSLFPNHTHLCMRPRADLRRGFHHLDLVRALHAPQLPNERRERPPLPRRDDVEIRRRLRLCITRI